MRLKDKRILITGATGIAAAAAARFAAEGAAVYVVSLYADECERLSRQVDLAGWADADLRDEEATENAISTAITRLDGFDGLLAVAGGSGRADGDGPLHQIPLQGWDATLALNLTTSFLAFREALRAMVGAGQGGSIAMVSSVLAMHPVANRFATHAYAAAKGAQVALIRATAAQYADSGIRINGIAPGLVATPMSRRAQENDDLVEYAKRKQPITGGFLRPDQVAAAAGFLLSNEADAITGQLLLVDGGWSVSEGYM